MQDRKKTALIITWLAVIVLLNVIVIFPVGYFIISYQHAAGSLESEAEINARIITRIISTNPTMWEFEQVRLLEYLSRRPRTALPEIRRVVNGRNELVAESSDVLLPPVMKRSVELFDSGTVVGRLEISRSLRPLLVRSGLLMIVMLPLGVSAFIIFRTWPLRTIRRGEEALRRERDTAQKYLDIAGVMLLVIDADQLVSLINKRGCEILRYSEEEIRGKNWFDLFVSDRHRSGLKTDFNRLKGKQEARDGYFEYSITTGEGEERVIAWHNIILRDDQGNFAGTLNSGEDITERRQLEAQLRHSQKMEAIGVLTGGIAHEFNNILAAIIGFAGLLQMKMDQNEPMRRHIDQILASSNQAADLVRSLLAFSRKQKMDPKPVTVNEIVRRVEKLLGRFLSADIELRTMLADEDATILADAGQIEQVLINLATNARDAMPEGGLLVIKTSALELDNDFIKSHGYGATGAYACITVSDTGVGMSEQTREKIFEPFYTTKEVGKGTGLGLSIVYGIIKQHDGYIDVYSEPGKGATFIIYLPLVRASARETDDADAAMLPAGGTETVLVADDDATVRSMTTMVLRNSGYAVIDAGDGEEAVHAFTRHKDEIKLVILDVVMPKKNGKVTYEAMRKMRPDLKVLFISGYSTEFMEEQATREADVHFLAKPATSAELLKKVREALDE